MKLCSQNIGYGTIPTYSLWLVCITHNKDINKEVYHSDFVTINKKEIFVYCIGTVKRTFNKDNIKQD